MKKKFFKIFSSIFIIFSFGISGSGAIIHRIPDGKTLEAVSFSDGSFLVVSGIGYGKIETLRFDYYSVDGNTIFSDSVNFDGSPDVILFNLCGDYIQVIVNYYPMDSDDFTNYEANRFLIFSEKLPDICGMNYFLPLVIK